MSDEKTPKVIKPLNENLFHQAGTKQNTWEAIAPEGSIPEDLLDRGFWAHVAASKMRPFDKVHVMAEDKSWYAEYVVFASYGNGAIVRMLGDPIVINKKTELPSADLDFEIVDLGLSKEWSIRQKSTGKLVNSGHKTSQEAGAWLRNWLAAQGKKAA